MAQFFTDFDEFSTGATSTNLTGFTDQSVANTTSTIADLGGGDHVMRHTKSANGLALITYDAYDTAGEVEAVAKITLATTSDQNAQIGPALIASDGRCYAWRANTTPTATTWRLALFTAAGSVSTSIGTAATFTEPTAGTPFWLMIGRNAAGEIYGSLWINDGERPGSPMASASNATLTNVKPGMTTWDSSDDPMDFLAFGAATEGQAAPEEPLAGGGDVLTVDSGSLALQGFDVALIFDEAYVIPVEHAQLALEGQEIPFILSQPGADAEMVLEGQDIQLLTVAHLDVDHGELALAGQDVGLHLTAGITVTAGQLALVGQVINLLATGLPSLGNAMVTRRRRR